MLKLYPEQLRAQLNEGLRAAYLLLGMTLFYCRKAMTPYVRLPSHKTSPNITLSSLMPARTGMRSYAICQALSLFASRQILSLQLPENGPNAALNERLALLVSLLHDDLILIVRGNKLTKAQENAAWYTALANRSVSVSCQTPEQANLPRWIAARAKQNNLQLDDAASQLLCYCYEGNLLAAQALERLALLFPDGKLTLPRVEQAVNDAAHFTPFHWVDALLAGKVSARFIYCINLNLKPVNRLSCCVPSSVS
jgi:DNA polymerase-3 subunit delta